jgi:hypothetical protein
MDDDLLKRLNTDDDLLKRLNIDDDLLKRQLFLYRHRI